LPFSSFNLISTGLVLAAIFSISTDGLGITLNSWCSDVVPVCANCCSGPRADDGLILLFTYLPEPVSAMNSMVGDTVPPPRDLLRGLPLLGVGMMLLPVLLLPLLLPSVSMRRLAQAAREGTMLLDGGSLILLLLLLFITATTRSLGGSGVPEGE
jgi:hypothetical protein